MADITFIDDNGRYSKAVIHGRVAYLAGQVAEDPSQDVEGQARQVLAQIDAVLARCGTDKTCLLTSHVYLKDLRDFAVFNTVWDAWVVPGRCPTRTPIEAKLALKDYLIEVEVTAAVKT